MKPFRKYRFTFTGIGLLFILIFLVNLSLGSVHIPLPAFFDIFLGSGSDNESWNYIVLNYRLPKAITAVLVGACLSISGLLMQTFFRNPLAGPFVLGISSGASLGVALIIMGGGLLSGVAGSILTDDITIALAASAGSLLVLSAVLLVAFRVRDTMALLIIGLMFSSLTSAVVGILAYFTRMEKLQQYIFWSYGSLGDLSWSQLLFFSIFTLLGTFFAIIVIKQLNALLLGENYARSMGVNVKRSRFQIILAASILTGAATAYAGPIAFVGLAVPHLTRQLFNTSNHKILLPAVMLFGGMLMLICDSIAQWPFSEVALPINAITSIVGAPVVIWLLVRKRKMIF
ncbi:FecCD family ABC transporter permease [Robertkochia aurantiaca]|uniref:FecCD family ABC transporter permease n=1 Tax=Robertkochia aurantiaca TaxID=2873700 RepID=UPI001CCFA982|nr:iron ABC transporter permease [Robertkochia sp. 3YJGBD-33]